MGVAQSFSYRDAVRLLGGAGGGVVQALDNALGAALLAGTAGGSELAIGLFDGKAEATRLSRGLVSGLMARLSGLNRVEQTDRLVAAHTIVAYAGYFEVVTEADWPFRGRELTFTRDEQLLMGSGQASASPRLRDQIDDLVTQSCGGFDMEAVQFLHTTLNLRLSRFVTGLDVWDGLSGADRDRARALFDGLPALALTRYRELLRQLITDFPLMAVWTGEREHAETQAGLAAIGVSLQQLRDGLDRLQQGGGTAQGGLAALAKRYKRVLERPEDEDLDLPAGIVLPPLDVAHLDPRFRAADELRGGAYDEESWWDAYPVQDDLCSHLLRYLVSPEVGTRPMLVLGRPGSGKSALSKVLAARLAEAGFLVVRVDLAEYGGIRDIQDQIERAARDATGTDLRWDELARVAQRVLLVVILDGLDEWLQDADQSQRDFLERVARFQEREADADRPVAVLVTVRTNLARQVRPPREGIWAIKLEPFADRQIGRWLEVWESANAAALAGRAEPPLPLDTALRYRELAGIPLYLAYLAVRGLDTGLPAHGTDLTGLLEHLLRAYTRREVHKSDPALDGGDLEEKVEDLLARLTLVATGMFTRDRRGITKPELTDDLAARPPGPASRPGRALPPTDGIVGRFDFDIEPETGSPEPLVRFHYGLFGDYLVARWVFRTLRAALPSARRHQPPRDLGLEEILSAAPLPGHPEIVTHLTALLETLPAAERQDIFQLLVQALHTPARGPLSMARHAFHTANLVLLMTLAHDGDLRVGSLFPRSAEPLGDWRRLTGLWHTQLTTEQWAGLARALHAERLTTGGHDDIRLTRAPWGVPAPSGGHGPGGGWETMPAGGTARRRVGRFADWTEGGRLLDDPARDLITELLRPLHEYAEDAVFTEVRLPDGRVLPLAGALVELHLASLRTGDPDALRALFRDYLAVVATTYDPLGGPDQPLPCVVVLLRQISLDAPRLGEDFRREAMAALDWLPEITSAEVRTWAAAAFGDLGYGSTRGSEDA